MSSIDYAWKIGFISNLPHGLVAPFRSTLDEIKSADLLLHVRDIANVSNGLERRSSGISSNYWQAESDLQRANVRRVIRELELNPEKENPHYLEVWNKIDLLGAPALEV